MHANQVRAMVDLLPSIDVVVDDPFNSHPTDWKLMGPDALQRYRNGETLPAGTAPTPLVSRTKIVWAFSFGYFHACSQAAALFIK